MCVHVIMAERRIDRGVRAGLKRYVDKIALLRAGRVHYLPLRLGWRAVSVRRNMSVVTSPISASRGEAEYRPADLGAPVGRGRGVARADHVRLVDRAVDGQGVLHHP